jgi:hypothetical protein
MSSALLDLYNDGGAPDAVAYAKAELFPVFVHACTLIAS